MIRGITRNASKFARVSRGKEPSTLMQNSSNRVGQKAGRTKEKTSSMMSKVKLSVTLLLAALAITVAFPAMGFTQDAGTPAAPTIQSDQVDYPPGAVVTLTGSGWQSGESVHINVNDDRGQTW